MISLTDCCGFFSLGLLFYWCFLSFFFSLNYSKERGFYPISRHFSRYFFYKSAIADFFFSRISALWRCLLLNPSKASLFLLTSSISLVSLAPSYSFIFLSMVRYCFLFTNCRSFIYSFSIFTSVSFDRSFYSSRAKSSVLTLLLRFVRAFS